MIFLSADKCQRFLQNDTSFWARLARHAQIIQNNKFAISLQHFQKKVSNVADFLNSDKHESLLQIDAKIF